MQHLYFYKKSQEISVPLSLKVLPLTVSVIFFPKAIKTFRSLLVQLNTILSDTVSLDFMFKLH